MGTINLWKDVQLRGSKREGLFDESLERYTVPLLGRQWEGVFLCADGEYVPREK